MQAQFLLGPAGSGKTFHCLADVRKALTEDADGLPLLLLAPKQTTYQLERQLLADPSLPGYTRLHILSFERLAFFIFKLLQKPPPRLLDEEGRLMVLRSLLARKRADLKLFRASARLTGFAQQLSLALRELQREQLTPETLLELAEKARAAGHLGAKLHDLATLLRDYLDWLSSRNLLDAELLPDFAIDVLRVAHPRPVLGGIWVDGFSEVSPQELELLAELIPCAPRATITFCLEAEPKERFSWLSHWSPVEWSYQLCRERLRRITDCRIENKTLGRPQSTGRFVRNPVLRHLEAHWSESTAIKETTTASTDSSLRMVACASPEAETVLAAREILQFVRDGGRFREVTVLARRLQDYHAPLVNTFTRYGIPYFLDRRESVSHHPLAELTRNALRTVALGWKQEDWFAALKTDLLPASDAQIDRLENEALARGWKGRMWLKPIVINGEESLSQWVEEVRAKIVPAFSRMALKLAQHKDSPNGTQLAAVVREFWQTLDIEEKLRQWTTAEKDPRPIHATVWEQMNAWLENVERAFPREPLPLRDWLPILDAGLAGLSVGVIPPALDQVLIGAIDRSRNPDIRLAIVLGMNEGVFPAPPEPSVLLTDADREELEKNGVSLVNARQQMGRERFYGYIACTRARERLVLSSAECDSAGNPLNPSPFLTHVQRLFPGYRMEQLKRTIDWRESEHATELIAPLLRHQIQGPASQMSELVRLNDLPELVSLREGLRHLIPLPPRESLSPAIAAKLFGANLRTSVSRMEQFAECPFKFFIHSGLRAEERKRFELDIRDQGSFQHDVLAAFHLQLHGENKRWRDITPGEARERIKAIAASKVMSFRDGLLQSSEENRFAARMMSEALQDFVETLVGWMREQYDFEPAAVELGFGAGDDAHPYPPWTLDLGNGHRLLLRGRIDRVDLSPAVSGNEALCVVVDYKSSHKKLDALLMAHGLQLQLPAYLNVLRHWSNPAELFGFSNLRPAGVFYVNLRGQYERGENRDETLANSREARRFAYRHTGRFDQSALPKLDSRCEVVKGDQFNYSRNKDGSISKGSKEALNVNAFIEMLDNVEASLRKMGCGIYKGVAGLDPYRKGTTTACDQCDYASICRIDRWTHRYRVLGEIEEES